MKNKKSNNPIRRAVSAAVTVAALVGSVAAARVPAGADEFTVGRTGADVAFSQYSLDGSGVTVAVIDSGIAAYHVDLRYPAPNNANTRVLASISMVPGIVKTDDACGHGTHVAGIIAGNGSASSGSTCYRTFYGAARNVNLVNVRVLDGNGQGTVSQVISGIQWCITNKARYNIRVINLSLGHVAGESYTTDPLCQALESAWKSGIVVVCAAGNQGRMNSSITPGAANEGYGTAYGSIQTPGNDPYVITVGATKSTDDNRANDKIATYSSRGPSRLDMILKPDLIAPGNQVISLDNNNSTLDTAYGGSNQIPQSLYDSKPAAKSSAQYFCLSGTSMAAPVVSGAAALLLQKDPTLTPDTVKARLMISADKWTNPNGSYDPCTYGAGYLNIPATLNCTAVPTASAVSPSLVRDVAGNVSVSNILWGNNIIWGLSTVTKPLNVIWGNNIIWGTSIIWGSNIIWGENVWTDNIIWGTASSAVDLSSTAIQGE